MTCSNAIFFNVNKKDSWIVDKNILTKNYFIPKDVSFKLTFK